MAHAPNSLNLVADIGGTNTRVALTDGCNLLTETIRRYANKDFSDLETILAKFIAEEGNVDPKAACVAMAGPVQDGRATLTNLDWTITNETLAEATTTERVAILNDLQAQGHAIDHLEADNLRQVLPGSEAQTGATKLVIGVGTGFNAAPVFYAQGQRLVPPSEAGHANLPLRNAQELRLCEFVSMAHGFPAVEDVLSGRGLERVYAFLSQENGTDQSQSAAEIMAACHDKSDAQAIEAARLFTRILGTVCGNLSLIQLPFGGIYLVGGVSRAFAPYLEAFGFADAFRDKGRFAEFMDDFAVHIVEDDYAALIGCAAHLEDTAA